MSEDDAQALVTRVFSAYLALMRKVQTTYWCVHAASAGLRSSSARLLKLIIDVRSVHGCKSAPTRTLSLCHCRSERCLTCSLGPLNSHS